MTTRRMHRDNPIPMTSSQYLRWTVKPVNDNGVMKGSPNASLKGTPFPGHTVQATGKAGEPNDEMDAGFLAAVRLAPRVVGSGEGEVLAPVAFRLFLGGWVVKKEEE